MTIAGDTIPAALVAAAQRGDGALVFHLQDGTVRLAVPDLVDRATRAARTLVAEQGVAPGERVALLGPNRPEWAVWACAAWLAGAVLVPLQISLRLRDAAAFEARLRLLVQRADCKVVVAHPDLVFAVPDGLGRVWTEELGAPADPPVDLRGDDPAVVQFTSGSTADPKGAVLTHAAVLAQTRALLARAGSDVKAMPLVGWAPFFHDLGLFLFLVTPALGGLTSHLIPTERFARDPASWLRLVEGEAAAITVGPQTAWAAALRAVTRSGAPVDLSTLELAWFGAEGIDPAFVDTMLSHSQGLRLSPAALGATYGLAEAVMGVTTTRRGAGIAFDRVARDRLVREGRAVEAGGEPERRIVACGAPMLGMEVRIADGSGVLGDREIGEIQVRGPSLMSGYLGDESGASFVDGWLRTGDLGYLHRGEVHVTGRAKDVLIVMGHNYYPDDFEWAASRVAGVRPGRCVAFVEPAEERLMLLVEPSAGARPDELAREVRAAVMNAVGLAPGGVRVLARGSIKTTTSGKLRRAAMRDAYLRGELVVSAGAG